MQSLDELRGVIAAQRRRAAAMRDEARRQRSLSESLREQNADLVRRVQALLEGRDGTVTTRPSNVTADDRWPGAGAV
jgi:hypothetical protein